MAIESLRQTLTELRPVLACWGCGSQALPMESVTTTEIYGLTVPEVRGPRSRRTASQNPCLSPCFRWFAASLTCGKTWRVRTLSGTVQAEHRRQRGTQKQQQKQKQKQAWHLRTRLAIDGRRAEKKRELSISITTIGNIPLHICISIALTGSPSCPATARHHPESWPFQLGHVRLVTRLFPPPPPPARHAGYLSLSHTISAL